MKNAIELVKTSSNTVMNELIKGKTVSEAVNKSHEFAAEQILKLIYSEDPWFSAH